MLSLDDNNILLESGVAGPLLVRRSHLQHGANTSHRAGDDLTPSVLFPTDFHYLQAVFRAFATFSTWDKGNLAKCVPPSLGHPGTRNRSAILARRIKGSIIELH
jgi:hypothetical protein